MESLTGLPLLSLRQFKLLYPWHFKSIFENIHTIYKNALEKFHHERFCLKKCTKNTLLSFTPHYVSYLIYPQKASILNPGLGWDAAFSSSITYSDSVFHISKYPPWLSQQSCQQPYSQPYLAVSSDKEVISVFYQLILHFQHNNNLLLSCLLTHT